MNCYYHPETAAGAFCRSCGRPLCAVCQHPVEGTIYCQDHAPAPAYSGAADTIPPDAANPYYQPPPVTGARPAVQTSPGLAFVLGLIPGVGAIYNGQYVKGLVHAVIFALMVSILNTDLNGASEAFLSIVLAAFILYMPFEAYHTARKRQMGVVLDEWSSFVAPSAYGSRAPVGPIILIAIGVLFLLDTLHVLEFREIGRFWPVVLILAGAWMLYSRLTPRSRIMPPASAPLNSTASSTPGAGMVETPHER